MRRTPRIRRVLALGVVLALVMPGMSGLANDTDLFRTNVPPNILLVVDNSKSMTNQVWHGDFGKEVAGFKWKDQTDCTYFRDIFDAIGDNSGEFKIYPGGRRVNYEDPTGWVVRTRGPNNRSWEPPVIDIDGNHVFNDANANGVQDLGEWDAYYKTCEPGTSDYYDHCVPIGQPVLDANGDPIIDGGTGLPQLYKSDVDGTFGFGFGAGRAVKVRTTIHPLQAAINAGIDPETYEFTTNDICGIDPSGWSLFTGEDDATTPQGFTVQIQAQYLDFLFSSPYGDNARPAVFAPSFGNDGLRLKSGCIDLSGGESSVYETFRRTRLMALRLVLRTVTCELNEDVRFGLAQFRFHGKPGDDNGGYVALPIENFRNEDGTKHEYTLHGQYATHEDHLKRVITRVGPDSQTPLAETLFQVYTFFMSRDANDLPPGRDWEGNEVAGVSFPVYEYNMDLHNPVPDEGGDLNLVGGHYVGSDIVTTHPKPSISLALDADGLDPLGDGGLVTFPAWDPNPAPDPVQYSCQKNFVLLITDGGSSGDLFDDQDDRVNGAFEPPVDIETATNLGFDDFESLIGDHYRLPDGSPDEEEFPAGTKRSNHMDDIAYFMNRWDFRPDLPGDQTIDVYTVGYSVESTGVSNVEQAAIRGNGLYFESADADQLATDIVAAFTDIIEKAQSFTSATVPASRTTDGDNFYSSYFRPKDDTPFWDGHLKNFEFTSGGDILTASGNCAIGADAPPPCDTSGVLRTAATGFWDASEEVPAPASRNLYVGFGDTTFGALPTAWNTTNVQKEELGLPGLDDADLERDPYNLPNPNSDSDLDALAPLIVSNVAGCQFGTTLGVDCAVRANEDGTQSTLGDIFHSNPVVVGSPNAPINDSSYREFAYQYRTRDRVIYAGANDGWLHAFHAGDWQTLDGAGDPLVPPRHDRGTGTELFAYMPSEIRDKIWELRVSQPNGSIRDFNTVDGSPVVSDAWIYRNVSGGNLTTLLSPPVDSAKVKEQWRSVLIGSLRDGGRSYFALDVTNPAASNYPGYLWEFPCDDCANAENSGSDSERSFMGETFSEPVITRVRVAVDGSSDPDGHQRWVAIFGAGYDPCGDPNDIGGAYWATAAGESCDAANSAKYRPGRAIYMVDITTGEVLAKKRYATVDTLDGTGQVGYDEMKYAFAAQPAVFDLDFDGFADVIYMVDLGGNVWKWVVTAVGDDPINNTTANHSVGQPDWPFKLFFHAEHSNGASPPDSTTHFQNFYFPPTAALRGSTLVLAFGAGERKEPEAGSVDGDDSNNNHYYVVRDVDPLERKATPEPTLGEDDLFTESEIDSGTYSCTEIKNTNRGYFLTGRDTEKFITNSVIFLGDVITGSFVPAPTGTDPCTATGQSYLYRFSLDCGVGRYPTDPGDDSEDRRKLVGYGIPTRPRVSVGGINQGGGGGGCDNKVVVITSDGYIDNDCPGTPPSSGIGIRSWRER